MRGVESDIAVQMKVCLFEVWQLVVKNCRIEGRGYREEEEARREGSRCLCAFGELRGRLSAFAGVGPYACIGLSDLALVGRRIG